MAWRPRVKSRFERGQLLACAAGALAALGHAPFGLWPATVLGLAAGFHLIVRAEGARRAAGRGWALGVGFFAATLIWIVQPFFVEPWRHGWMAPFALLFMAGGLALFWGVAAGLAHRFGLWLWPALMSAAELVRGWVFTGFPWGEPGVVWVDTPLAQLSAFVGAAGLTLATFVLAALVVSRKGAALAVSLLAAGWIAGAQRPAEEAGTDTVLRLVQPNAAQHLKWDPAHAPGFVERQIALSATPADRAPDLVIWPETAVPYLLRHSQQVFDRATRAAGAPVILGIQRGEGMRYFNSMAMVGEDGILTQVYDKAHLVPFGEYVPGGDLLSRIGIGAFAAQRGYGYSPGPGAAVLDMGAAGKVLPLICYEAIFARDLRAAPERADWILQLTNDAWFGTFSGPQQHLAQARMRAIEMGLPFVRAANTGISAVVDPFGRITAALGLGQTGIVDAPLPAPLPQTLYARLGNLPLILLLLGVALGRIVRGRAKGIDPDGARM